MAQLTVPVALPVALDPARRYILAVPGLGAARRATDSGRGCWRWRARRPGGVGRVRTGYGSIGRKQDRTMPTPLRRASWERRVHGHVAVPGGRLPHGPA